MIKVLDQLLPRLIRVDLRSLRGGKTLAVTPKGNIFEIDSPPETVKAVLKKCDGTLSLQEIIDSTPDPVGFKELLDILAREGSITFDPSSPQEKDWARSDGKTYNPENLAEVDLYITGDKSLLELIQSVGGFERFRSIHSIADADLESILSGSRARMSVVLSINDCFDPPRLTWIDELCERHSVPWTQFHLDQGIGWLGPAIIPGRTINYRELLVRRKCAAEHEDVFEALLTEPLLSESCTPPHSDLTWMLSIFVSEVERWLSGAPSLMLSTELEVDPVRYTVKWYTALPLPNRELTGDLIASAPKDFWLLINKRAGIITGYRQIRHHESVPKNLITVQTDVASMYRHFTWANNTVCGGSAFDDFNSARDAAIGEAIERCCGNYVHRDDIVSASYAELVARGKYALDPEKLISYSKRQYSSPGFPFVPFTKNLMVRWVRGHSLTKDCPAWVPMSLVYVNWNTGPFKGEPATNYMYYPGIAAGPNLEFALASGLEEIIERDVTMCWWMNRQPLPAIRLTPELQGLWASVPAQYGQRAWLIHLDNPFGVPVMAGVVENTVERLLNVGFAARPDPVQAGLKAWTEALTLQEGSRDLLEPDGLLRQAISLGEFEGESLKPWRADRAYMDSYRADFKDVDDLMCQQQFFLDHRAVEMVRPILDTEATRTFDELPILKDRSVLTYRRAVEQHGFEVFYVDTTTPDVAHSGLKVVRVIVPGLVPNFSAAFPFLGQGRVQQFAVDMGWRDEPLSEEDLNYSPLPHA